MEYDENHNVMWTVEVCGEYGIEAWDYGNPCALVFDCLNITGWCERGVAYDPVEDRLYVSNWFSGVIYKLNADDCSQVGYCDLNYLGYPYYSVAGLAFDENHRVIWVLTNSAPDYLFAVVPFDDGYYGNCTLADCYNGPMPWGCFQGDYKGGGMDYDKTTNELYAQNQANQWSGTYTEVFDVGDCTAPAFNRGCLNVDGDGNLVFGWGLGKMDGADHWWITGINASITPPQTFYCQSLIPQECVVKVLGFQTEVPPGVKATLDLLVEITNNTCEPIVHDLVFEFYRDKGCMGDPIRVLTAANFEVPCGTHCYVFAWGPVPNLPVCNWYSCKVIFCGMCEACFDFHIGDPTPGMVNIEANLF
jgi:hypothetical protein